MTRKTRGKNDYDDKHFARLLLRVVREICVVRGNSAHLCRKNADGVGRRLTSQSDFMNSTSAVLSSALRSVP